MDRYRLTITEKQKLINSFNLLNFRDEVVNFMYKKTVADASRKSLLFYVAIFFLSLKNGEKSLMRDLLDTNLNKIRKLNKLLSEKKRLKKGEYTDLVAQAGLASVFKYDIFFLLISAVVDADELKETFSVYLSKNPEIEKEFDLIVKEYEDTFQGFREEFSAYVLIDDRWDDRGNYHDLGKSVMRPVKMRTSKHVDLTLHKYAEVKKISSESPLVVEIIQNIDPEILIRIWEVYNLDKYALALWDFINSPIVSGALVAGGTLYADRWLQYRKINGRTDREGKKKARDALEIARGQAAESGQTNDLLNGLVKSVLSTNEYLQSELTTLHRELKEAKQSSSVLIDKDKQIAELEDRIEKLENIKVDIRKEK